MMQYLPEKDSAVWRAIMTFLQTIAGVTVGLILVVWNVPTVPQVVITYLTNNVPQILLLIGIPAGLTSLVINIIRPSVKNV